VPSIEEISQRLAGLGRRVTIESDTPTKITTVPLARMLVAATDYHALRAEHALRRDPAS